jgi:3-deoxy-D-manno-octulosonic acid (KDO) 8-phosphate synthase
MVEVHPDPDSALSDAEQQLDIPEFAALMRDLLPIHEHVRDLHNDPRSVPQPVDARAAGPSRH